MKILRVCLPALLAASTLPVLLAAQEPDPIAALLRTRPATPATPDRTHPVERRVSRPPEETKASLKTRTSTAEAGSARMKQQPLTTLPAFRAMGVDGRALAVSSTARAGHWLLVYRRDLCVPCDQTLLALARSASPDLKGGLPYTIVVADASASSLVTLKAKFSTLSNATWIADTNKEAFTALKPRGTPMLYALDGDRIAWSAPGNLGNPALVEHQAAEWLAAPAGSLTSNSTSSTLVRGPAVSR